MNDYYVYELIDYSNPDEPKVFYVGKGVGSRVKNHARKVLQKIANDIEISDPKEIALQRLLINNASPDALKELVIGRYKTEDEAFAVESTLIKWVYGHENLTNIVHGHGARQIRNKGNYDFDQDLQPPSYMVGIKRNIEERGVEERATSLKGLLEAIGFSGLFQGWQGQDYGIYWPVPNFPIIVQIKMQANNNKVVLNARPSMQTLSSMHFEKPSKSEKDINFQRFKELIRNSGYIISAPDSFSLIFASLFESTIKGRDDWNTEKKVKIFQMTGEDIKIKTSLLHGIEATNIELIGGYLRDLHIRLSIADFKAANKTNEDQTTSLLHNIIRLFQSKPASKYFLRGSRNDD